MKTKAEPPRNDSIIQRLSQRVSSVDLAPRRRLTMLYAMLFTMMLSCYLPKATVLLVRAESEPTIVRLTMAV